MAFSFLLFAHWVGDFALQTTNMALQKSYSMRWLGFHILTYTGIILFVSLLLLPPEQALKYGLINGLLHGITDFFTSKLSARFAKTPRIFYPIIGFDQMIHILTLYWTLKLI